MPTYASYCRACEREFEWTSARMTTFDPACVECGGPTERGYFPIAAIWTRGISDYGDKRGETYRKDIQAGGHWTFEKNSDAAQSAGRPLPVLIRTQQDQNDYCRREKLINPKDLPSNLSVAADGASYEKANLSEI